MLSIQLYITKRPVQQKTRKEKYLVWRKVKKCHPRVEGLRNRSLIYARNHVQ